MLSQKLKALREVAGLPQRKVAAAIDLDTATYCKIEKGIYLPKKSQVVELAKFLNCDEEALLKLWMADRISMVAEDDKDLASDALRIVQESLKY